MHFGIFHDFGRNKNYRYEQASRCEVKIGKVDGQELYNTSMNVVVGISTSKGLAMQLKTRSFFVAASMMLSGYAVAFGLQLDTVKDYFDKTEAEMPRKVIPFLDGKYPVHQDLTSKTLNCGVSSSPCAAIQAVGINPSDVMKGVRWNDFPAFYMTKNAGNCENHILRATQPKDVHCYVLMLGYAYLDSDRYVRDPNWAKSQPLGARGHFGDLQFWHSMAQANQSGGATYQEIQMWMEFAFRASLGEFKLTDDITTLPVPGLKKHFWKGARRVGDLLDYRYESEREVTQGIALGQMLHIAQDSFAKCHAQRDDEGRMVRFYNYSGQSGSMHKHFDVDSKEISIAVSRRLNPYDFGEKLLRIRGESTTWDQAGPKVRKLVEEYFRPMNPYLLSRYGEGCYRA